MTKVNWYEEIAKVIENCTNYADREEAIEFLNHEKELIEKRKSTPRKPSKKQVENGTLKNEVEEILKECGKPISVKELMESEKLSNYTTQKITSMITQLRNENRVVCTENKRTKLYSVA